MNGRRDAAWRGHRNGNSSYDDGGDASRPQCVMSPLGSGVEQISEHLIGG
jgi:hypothetical protein